MIHTRAKDALDLYLRRSVDAQRKIRDAGSPMGKRAASVTLLLSAVHGITLALVENVPPRTSSQPEEPWSAALGTAVRLEERLVEVLEDIVERQDERNG